MLKKLDQNALGPFSVENKIILITIIFIYFTSDKKERETKILMPTSFMSTLTFVAIIIIISSFVPVYEQLHRLVD